MPPSFAPNALDDVQAPPQYAAPAGRQWYDRLMDVLLGEDEMKPINRVALICRHCKLVNGQAPPGAKDVGRWRCMGCRGWNGEKGEVQAILEEAGEETGKSKESKEPRGTPEMAEKKGGDEDSEVLVEDEDDEPPARSTRSRKKESSDDT